MGDEPVMHVAMAMVVGLLRLRRDVHGALDGDVHVDVCERGEFGKIAAMSKSTDSSSPSCGAERRGGCARPRPLVWLHPPTLGTVSPDSPTPSPPPASTTSTTPSPPCAPHPETQPKANPTPLSPDPHALLSRALSLVSSSG